MVEGATTGEGFGGIGAAGMLLGGGGRGGGEADVDCSCGREDGNEGKDCCCDYDGGSMEQRGGFGNGGGRVEGLFRWGGILESVVGLFPMFEHVEVDSEERARGGSASL